MAAWHAEQAGEFEQGRVLLTEALANADRPVPNLKLTALAHANLGVLLNTMGKSGDGVQELEQAVAIIPDNPQYHYKLGLAAQQAGDKERARAAFRTAVTLAPTLREARDALAGI
jgi:Flp pilus assembly protein TadD